jgi:hypothetical protein
MNKKNSNMSGSVQVNYYTFEDEKLMESSNFVQYLGRNNTNGTNNNNKDHTMNDINSIRNNPINSLNSLNNREYDNNDSQNINEKIIQKNPCIIIKEPSIFKKKDIDKIIFLQSNIRNYLNNKNIENDNKDKLKKNKNKINSNLVPMNQNNINEENSRISTHIKIKQNPSSTFIEVSEYTNNNNVIFNKKENIKGDTLIKTSTLIKKYNISGNSLILDKENDELFQNESNLNDRNENKKKNLSNSNNKIFIDSKSYDINEHIIGQKDYNKLNENNKLNKKIIFNDNLSDSTNGKNKENPNYQNDITPDNKNNINPNKKENNLIMK